MASKGKTSEVKTQRRKKKEKSGTVKETQPVLRLNHWIGYSWFITPSRAAIYLACESESEKSKDTDSYLLWKPSSENVPFPEMGVMETLGISGIGGYYKEAQSLLSKESIEWLQQVKRIDSGFERILADMLTETISTITSEITDNEEHCIIVQGPAFPKLIGRLSYRRILENHPKCSLVFMTFRRRFLTPNPVQEFADNAILTENRGILAGPFPSLHEDSICRKYYFLPNHDTREKSAASSKQLHYPLMIESFNQTYDVLEENRRLNSLFQGLGVTRRNGEIVIRDEARWVLHPGNAEIIQKVFIPIELRNVNNNSILELQNNVSGKKAVSEEIKKMCEVTDLLEKYEDIRLHDVIRSDKIKITYTGAKRKKYISTLKLHRVLQMTSAEFVKILNDMSSKSENTQT
ncbi:MAG: hypothetical protein K8R90_08900 [Candidatus Cloacimonetes bacterium]|nr:hypothetical protein [Candidatus Cloacimonadota bacterium]